MDDLDALARRAQCCDTAALSAFVRRTQQDVWRLCSYLGSAATAEDLSQETCVRALRALPEFRGDAPAKAWLLSIARRTCADAVRRARRDRRLAERVGPRDVLVQSGAGRVDLDQLVRSLDDDRRAAFVLTQVLALTYEEAAEICDCPIGTIRSRVSRARLELVAAIRRSDESSIRSSPARGTGSAP
jgi:RNA polymerase sigma-70 factor (ECF subfamily)